MNLSFPLPLLTRLQGIWEYHTQTALWNKIIPQIGPRYNTSNNLYGPSVAACLKSTIYGTLPDGTFASYNLTASVWTTLAKPPKPLRCSAIYAVGNDTIHAVGGVLDSGARSDATQVFHPVSNTWSQIVFPRPITAAGAIAVGGVEYVYGGSDQSQLLGNLDALTPVGSWSVVENGTAAGSPPARENMCFEAWNNTLVLWGGQYSPTILSESGIWLFNVTKGSPGGWSDQPLQLAPGATAPNLTNPITCTVVGSVLHIWGADL
ncbi:hypothetical protein BDK51DRAFT_33381 [Blyttiomyces helicus]|uniref:Galactose oxidase n=1 Tax=Blyttiomyces helicus TaxID=388810 RepID=A0A4P9VX85_9FUNG|nr:hypothetical protein BDK51DRAFT_33381 [Blyttiomyces helicus]|eukprot:RKO84331.1 hypothetical protein BDK51DRAFT_33381 [Blyttiomyces helicus]